MSIIYQAMNKHDKSMQDKADKSWVHNDDEGFNINRNLIEDYEAHYALEDSRLIKKRMITAFGLTILLIAIYAAVQ